MFELLDTTVFQVYYKPVA